MENEMYSTGTIAKIIAEPRFKIEYAISSGYLPEAESRFLGKRCFNDKELKRIAEYFGKELNCLSTNL